MIMQGNIAIILVNPQLGENIGSVARIMKNFAVNDLRIISPRDGWPNDRANILAAGGQDIIDNAVIYNNLVDAIKDLSHLYACSARVRNMNKETYDLKDHIADLKENPDIINSKLGVMFGSERSGLNNEDINYAKKIINISGNPEYNILNLAQSVALICYEYFGLKNLANKSKSKFLSEAANLEEVNFFIRSLQNILEKKGEFKDEGRQNKMYQNLNNIFIRNNLTQQEVRTLLGVIKILIK
jgi:tRNA/rRNA methyltransferase